MSNPTNNGNSQELQPTMLVPSDYVPEIADLYAINQAVWGEGEETLFPTLGERLYIYSKNLEGVPFSFASGVEEIHIPERKYGDMRYAAQDGLRVWVRLYNFDVPGFDRPKLAQLTDMYLCNQLRGADETQLLGSGVWTVWRNPEFDTPSGHPRMLTRYRHNLHKPPTRVTVTEEQEQEVQAAADRWDRPETHSEQEARKASRALAKKVQTLAPHAAAEMVRQQRMSKTAVHQAMADIENSGVRERVTNSKEKPGWFEGTGNPRGETMPWSEEDITPVKRGPGRPKGSRNVTR